MLLSPLIRRLTSSNGEHAQTIVEYGLIIGLVSLVGFVAVALLQGGALGLFGLAQTAANCMANMVAGGSCTS